MWNLFLAFIMTLDGKLCFGHLFLILNGELSVLQTCNIYLKDYLNLMH